MEFLDDHQDTAMTSLHTHFSWHSADLDSPWQPAILIEAKTSVLQYANIIILCKDSLLGELYASSHQEEGCNPNATKMSTINTANQAHRETLYL